MSTYREDPNREAPSPVEIGSMVIISAAVITVTCWIGSGPELDGRGLAGFILGVLASCMLLGRTLMLGADRAVIRAERKREEPVRIGDVGTWAPPPDHVGLVVTVSWLSDTRTWRVEGWPVTFWGIDGGSWDDLRARLLELEAEGWTAVDDNGTRAVRARLGILPSENVIDTMPIRY